MLCAGLDDEFLPALNAISSKVTLEKGENLFIEGDRSTYVYNVIEGFLRLSRLGQDGRRQVLGFLTTGDYLGHTSRSEYTLSAEALSDLKVCRFRREDLQGLLSTYPRFERQFHHMTAGLLDDMLDLVFTIGRKNALERVASFLVYQMDRKSVSDTMPGSIWLPMTRADIADFLGLTLETVSRAFSRMKKNGVISIDHAHTINILDRGRLIDLSEGNG
ncbi:nitrogen fixation regulation protein FixK [Kordiimonas sediminis]|uniref:Nitrogen fixation regulation protein FixK n=2 Tax=Kordiimonas sediminis TaxID=1735581 RepID=A0A919AWL2_9PROT|nr:nitrogen fixation regulation protein FixK [Kordiimonas sediminis]